MTIVHVGEAKTELSKLLQRVLAGEEVAIARAGKPLVRLTPIESVKLEPRAPGLLEGQFPDNIGDAFLEPMSEEELALWEGPVFPENASEPEGAETK